MDIHPLPSILQKTEGVVLPNVFQNGFSSSRGAAPSEEPEPELFSEEPEPCQTGPCVCVYVRTRACVDPYVRLWVGIRILYVGRAGRVRPSGGGGPRAMGRPGAGVVVVEEYLG